MNRFAWIALATIGLGGIAQADTSTCFLFAASSVEDLAQAKLPDNLGRIEVACNVVIASTVVPTGFYIDAVGERLDNKLYAGDANSNALRTITGSGGSVTSMGSDIPTSKGEDFASNGKDLYRAYWDVATSGANGKIFKLDPTTGSATNSWEQADVVGMTFVGSEIWISKWSTKSVGVWDPTTNTFTEKFKIGANAGGLAYDGLCGVIWVGEEGGAVKPYDLTGVSMGAGVKPFGDIRGTIDSLACIPVPESATLIAVGLGGLTLAAHKRRARKS